MTGVKSDFGVLIKKKLLTQGSLEEELICERDLMISIWNILV